MSKYDAVKIMEKPKSTKKKVIKKKDVHQNLATNIDKIVDSYFRQNNGKILIRHQIDSYNDFIRDKIPAIVSQVNPLVVGGMGGLQSPTTGTSTKKKTKTYHKYYH